MATIRKILGAMPFGGQLNETQVSSFVYNRLKVYFYNQSYNILLRKGLFWS